jgi:predicted dehydrogenase
MMNKNYKRRTFLKNAALASSSAILLPNLSFGTPNSSKDVIRIGVIGTGDRGTGLIHLIQQIEGLKVVACCDVIPFRLENAIKEAGKDAQAYTDYHKLLDSKEVDAVIISTPFGMHTQMAMDAVDATKHIYCEKTMSKGVHDTLKLVEKVKNYAKIFQVGHQYHSSLLYKKVVEILQQGYIGDLSGFECQWNRNHSWRREVPDPQWEKMINWRMYKEYSGGLMAELCSHQVDFINWILNAYPQKVMGMGGIDYWKDGRETYDNIHILMEYPKGIKAKFTCLTTNKYEEYQIKILGKKGTIIMGYDNASIYIEDLKEEKKQIVDGVSGATRLAWEAGKGAPIDVGENTDYSIQALINFRDNILNTQQPLSNVITGAKVSFIVQMALDAMDTGNTQFWKKKYEEI